MKKNIGFFLASISVSLAFAQPCIQWQKCLGGSNGDWAQSIQETMDAGYILAGFTMSNDGDVSGNHGNEDFWIVKLDSAGTIIWQKCLGGSGHEFAYAVQQTVDSGYIVGGFATSNDGDVSGNHGNDDYWIVKLNSSGEIQWQKCFGSSGFDDALSIQQTTDGGYIIAGDTESNDGDVTGNHGGYDSWILKLDSLGNMQWQKCIGGSGDDTSPFIQQTSDGGYIAVGSTTSNDGDAVGNHGNWDYWVVKLSDTGGVEWQKCLGGTGEDIGYSIQQTDDNSYIVAGFTKSNNGDVIGIHGTGAQPDYWVIKLTSDGEISWQKCLGGTGDDKAYSIRQTEDDGYIVAGYTLSNDGDVSDHHEGKTHDYWVVKLSEIGNIQWQKCLGGSATDWARSIQQTTNNSYILVGFTESNDEDVSGNHGNTDFWVVKVEALETSIVEYSASTWQVFPNPSSGKFSIIGNAQLDNAVLQILNLSGQVVYQSSLNKEKTEIELPLCSEAVYFAHITSENERWVGKIIIK